MKVKAKTKVINSTWKVTMTAPSKANVGTAESEVMAVLRKHRLTVDDASRVISSVYGQIADRQKVASQKVRL